METGGMAWNESRVTWTQAYFTSLNTWKSAQNKETIFRRHILAKKKEKENTNPYVTILVPFLDHML